MIEVQNKALSGMTFIDLFAGIGGFHLALESLGAKCVYSSEWDKFAQKTYFDNFGMTPDGDITLVDENTIPNHDILCAGFPCQAFSISGKKLGFDDSRGTLFFDVARIVKCKKPKIVFMENVKNFATHDNGNTIKVVSNTMKELGYTFFYKVLNAANYNVPQNRERIYMVCFRNDLCVTDFDFPSSIILTKHLEDVLLKESDIPIGKYVHRTDIVISNASTITPSNKPIGVGHVGEGRQGERIYSPKGVAITLSANGGGIFAKTGGYIIGNKYRRLMPRECARVMGFPDTYIINENENQAYKQFGNSVVVDVLQHIAIKFSELLIKNEAGT